MKFWMLWIGAERGRRYNGCCVLKKRDKANAALTHKSKWFSNRSSDHFFFHYFLFLPFYILVCTDSACNWFSLIQKPDSTPRRVIDRRSCAVSHYHNAPLGFTNDPQVIANTHAHTHLSTLHRNRHAEQCTHTESHFIKTSDASLGYCLLLSLREQIL